MSTYMGRELELLVQSMICGALLVLVYDGIRIFRIIGKRVKSLDTAVDILFWSAAGLFLFFMCLRENGGSVRCYLLCGILLDTISIQIHFAVCRRNLIIFIFFQYFG